MGGPASACKLTNIRGVPAFPSAKISSSTLALTLSEFAKCEAVLSLGLIPSLGKSGPFGQALGKNGGGGEFDMYPESDTNFFLKINGAQLTFIKNDKGEATAVIHHIAGLPDSEGKKLNSA